LFEATGKDSDRLVHEVLIRFTATFVDQGFAGWKLPKREQGFFRAFMAYYGQGSGPPDRWLRGLRTEIERLQLAGTGPIESIAESLQMLGVEEPEAETYLSATLLALRGWAGMLRQLEERPDRVPRGVAQGTLIEFLAIRLILERVALTHLAVREMEVEEPLRKLRTVVPPRQATLAAAKFAQIGAK
jgi:hypothetical protein